MPKLFNRVEFWIFLFFVIRLTGITNPPLEISHNWRQTTGLMVARNFLEVDASILYPRVDDNMGKSGIIAMEFPLLNYLHFLLAKIFGYQHWYGRLINLIVSSFGLFFFYKLIEKFWGHRHALFSTLCLIGSIWFSFSRKMMPDTFCISLIFAGIYYGSLYLEKGKSGHFLTCFVLTSLAMLSKIPAAIYLPLFFALLVKNKFLYRKVYLSLALLTGILLTYVWYFLWNPYLAQQFGNWYNIGKPFLIGFKEIISNPALTAEKFLFSSFSGYLFVITFLTGLTLMIIKKHKVIILTFILVFIPFLLYMLKSGSIFYHHNYYIIPFVPLMAFIAGYSLTFTSKKWMVATVLIVGIGESIANQQHDFFIKNSEKYKLKLESIAAGISDKNDLIAINGNGNPQQIYLSHRKGWTCNDGQLTDTTYINYLKKNKCRFIIVNKHTLPELSALKSVYNDENYAVYTLDDL